MISYHKRQSDNTQTYLRKTKRICNQMFTLRIITFLLILVEIYHCTFSFGTMNVILLIALILAFLTAYHLDSLYQERAENLKALIQTHENEIKALQGDHSAFPHGEEHMDKSHEYTFDLDIFGKDSLYNRICRCTTHIGNERLAYMLKHLSISPEEIQKRMEAVREIGEGDDGKEWISRFITHKHTTGRIREVLPLITSDSNQNASRLLQILISWKFHLLWTLPLCIFWSAFICSATGILPYSITTLLFVLNLAYANLFSKTLKRLFVQTSSLRQEFKSYTTQLHKIEQRKFRSVLLKEQYDTLFGEKHNAIKAFKDINRILTNAELRNHIVVFLIGEGLFILSPLTIRQFLKWKQTHLTSMPLWVDAIAEFDAYASMGNYAMNHPDNQYATPHKSAHFHINAKAIRHPFLNYDKAVPNDFVQNENDIFIITGANMAGKSTMLRTIGISIVMSSCGMPVCAESMEYVPTYLFSNMRTSDDLSRNISYFNAELIRLGQLIEYCKHNQHTYIILDEILKGTNSEDKLKGSLAFLRYIVNKNVSGIVATHDLAISELESDSKHFHNFCFEIEMSSAITYSYKMTCGVARNMNATFLLKKLLV